MKTSIIVAAHNEERYIPGAFEGIAGQDAFEVIVVDNAGPDDTFGVASRFRDLKVVPEQKKATVYLRNRGACSKARLL